MHFVFWQQMKRRLRVPFALLALVAMFATMLPQALWACPMTGRVDSAARVCQGMMPMVNGTMPCAKMGGKCCKPVSVPSSQDDGDSHHTPAFTVLGHPLEPSPFAVPTVESTPFIVPSGEAPQAPTVGMYLARFTNSPPAYLSRYRPAALAGRAPPVL